MKRKVSKKVLRRALSLILVITMIVTGMNLNVMSDSIYAAQKQEKKNEKVEEKVKVVKELVDERTENSNTYLLSDGSKQTEIFTENIRFKKDGKFSNYDPILTKLGREDKEILDKKASENIEDYLFVNESGDRKQYFPKKLNQETGILLNYGKYVVSMAPDLEEEKCYTPDKESDTITYESGEEDISYQYISMKDGVKENIILNSKPEKYTFEYKIKTKNISLKQRKNDKGILICDKKNDEVVGYIAPPNITDGDGNTDYENIKYYLTKKNNETIIVVEVEEDYFKNAELKYPVTIDPTMRWMSDYLTTAGVWSASFMANSTINNNPLTVSNYLLNSYPYDSENRIYLDTTNLLSGNAFVGDRAALKNKYIESAELVMSEGNKPAHYPTGTVQVKRALGKWDPLTITWNTQPDISDDYIAETVCTGKEGTRHTLDITDWVQDIADEKIEDYGLVFTCPDKGMSAILYGPEFKYILDENGRPKEPLYMTIVVNYREMEKYDATVELNAEYDSETGKIKASVANQNELPEGTTISGYKIYGRENSASKFSVLCKGESIEEAIEILPDKAESLDLRACILYSDGTVKPSNIVSLEKQTDTEQDEDGSETTTISYEQTTFDTDGDGLEDGYEIWDLKTLWNTEIGVDEEGNKTYDLDTDKDGFPDSYEVFTLGTDPATANRYAEDGTEIDSDGDGWSDLTEYQKGTDPWLVDSDFDGINDKSDSKPRETNKRVSQIEIANAESHRGLYDTEVKEIENDVIVTQIVNIYSGRVCQKYWNYNNSNFNKYMKFFYDDKNNCTAVIESYDEEYDPNAKKVIGVTYSYNETGNITVLCDQSTRYVCEYENGELSNLTIGNMKLVSYKQECVADNLNENGEDTNLSIGDVITENTQTTSYGNNQKITKKSTVYKTEESDTTQAAQIDKIYYDDSDKEAYIIKYNNEGRILEVSDYTYDNKEGDNSENLPIIYTYTYDEEKTKIVRSDDFIKEEQKLNEEHSTAIITKYQSKDLKNNIDEHITSRKTMLTDEKSTSSCTLFNNDKLTVEKTISNDNKDIIENVLFSQLYNKNIFKVIETEESDVQTKYTVELYGQTKCFIYKYDEEGKIASISDDNEILYSYEYDAHGRLIIQKDCINKECHEYIYNNTGNVYADWKYPLDENNKIINSEGTVKYYEYDNTQWEDQLTAYNGEKITYDTVGNPIEYVNEMKFTWGRGKNLETVHKKEKEIARYKYNENGLRTNKTTDSIETEYTWDENKLIRECVNYKKTGKKYDIWYFFDENNDVIGFEYAQISSLNGNLKKTRIYYEKNKQGDIIGLLDSRGAEIAIYEYDVWGNIVNTVCYEGYEEQYELNHIGYRGYYRDNETGFYYLKNRYYDSNIGRFISASGNLNIMGTADLLGQNMYSYCLYKPSQYITLDNNNEILLGKKRYKGQEKGAYGYGGIVSPYDYVKDRYGGSISVYQAKTLTMRNYVMSDLEWNANNCSLVAITRVLNYYSLHGYKKIPSNDAQLYNKVKSVGKKYGYTASKGTWPSKINNIVNDVTKHYGYGKSRCHGIYVWGYDWQVKDEINKNRPVIMNILSGYYGDHSVTVCGYVVYRKKHKIGKFSYCSYYKMIEIYDGWSSTRHYIDYNAFARSQLGSFNTTIMKK